ADDHVALRLVRHELDASLRGREGRLRVVRIARLRSLRPVAECAAHRVLRRLCRRAAGDDQHRTVGRDRALVERADLRRRRGSNDLCITDRGSLEGMARGIDELAPGAVGYRARIALVLLETRERLSAHELDL